MKTIPILKFVLLLAIGARADSITFTEALKDKYACFTFEGERECGVQRSLKATIQASIKVPGLNEVEFADEDVVTLALGSQSITFTFADAESGSTRNRAVFLDQDCEEGPCEVLGRLTLSRSGDVMNLSASFNLDADASIVAVGHTEEAGSFSGPSEGITFQFSAGSVGPISRQVYYQGKTKITHKTVGTDEEEETIDLASVEVSGAADYTKPQTSVVFPKPNATYRADDSNLDVRIKATDNASVSEVFVALNDGEFLPAEAILDEEDEPTDHYLASLELAPGLNTLRTYAVDRDANVSRTNTQQVTYVIVQPLTLKTGPDGTVAGATSGQLLELNKRYKLSAKPDKNFLFERWVIESALHGTNTSNAAVLTFAMETNLAICASFITNKFLSITGSYNGLFAPTNDLGEAVVALTNAGFVTLKLTGQGRFSGQLLLAGGRHPFSGAANLDGTARVVITPKNQTVITLDLVFDLDEDGLNEGVSGTISRDGWVAAVQAVAAAARETVAALAGNYTFLIPGAPAEQADQEPAGDGAATAKLAANADFSMVGALGDGTAFSGAVPVSGRGEAPIFQKLYGGKGLLWGWTQFITNAPHLSASNLVWIKNSGILRPPIYTNGFAVTGVLNGARYVAPSAGSNAVDWPTTNGVVLLDGGNCTATSSNQVSLVNNKIKFLDGNTNRIKLTLTPRSGVITGTFRHPVTGRDSSIKGVLLQLPSPDGIGGGWFRGTTESGYLRLEQAPTVP